MMELPLASPARCELRAVICFSSAKCTTPIDIHRQLCEVYGPQCIDVKNVQKWVREFMYGQTDIHDVQRSGRPLILAETIAKVEQEQEMLEDRHVTVHELCERVPEVSKSTIGNVAGEFYDKNIRKMPKCIDRNGDYIEK